MLYNGPLPPKLPIAFPWGIWTPSDTLFLGPTRVHSPNGVSIDSAAFAVFTAERPYTLQWVAFSPKNCPFPWGIWTQSNT